MKRQGGVGLSKQRRQGRLIKRLPILTLFGPLPLTLQENPPPSQYRVVPHVWWNRFPKTATRKAIRDLPRG